MSVFEILGSSLPSSRLGTQSGQSFFYLFNQLRQFLLALFLAVSVDVPGHPLPVDLGRVPPLPEVISDLRHASSTWIAVLALDRLEGGAGGLFLDRRIWPRFRLDDGAVDLCRRRLPHSVGDMGVDIQCRGAGDVPDDGGQGLDVHPVLQGVGGGGRGSGRAYSRPAPG